MGGKITIYYMLLLVVISACDTKKITDPPLYGSITGYVEDSNAKTPISDAKVILKDSTNKTSGTTETNDDGKFIFMNLVPQNFSIFVTANGYEAYNSIILYSPYKTQKMLV